MASLELRQVAVEYTMKRTRQPLLALRNISLSVAHGQFVALVGPSGCGKSTLLNVVAGLQPASHGEVWLDGTPVVKPGRNRALVFQSPSLLPWRTVLRNVTYGLELQGAPPREAAQRARRYIDLVALNGFEESYPHELSGGMQQRANLARALATDPELLLLDEPLAALDPQMREVMQAELQHIWLQTAKTALFVTHLISEAVFLGDTVVVLSARPGTVRAVVPIDLPRPRTGQLRRSPRFRQLEDTIADLLQTELPTRLSSI
ncbi:MAG: ABC transporter ATP-binding protein [Anaerolineae bacterium]|nr:ABC transporter ATP-binding protein [Anaerolineae bacterium]